MKNIRLLLLAIVLAIACTSLLQAGERTLTTTVNGNCGSCKKRIVRAAESVPGVDDASWDKKTKQLTVVYDDAKTAPDAIIKAVADAGHDVPKTATRAVETKASDKAYDALPDCCRYRDKASTH